MYNMLLCVIFVIHVRSVISVICVMSAICLISVICVNSVICVISAILVIHQLALDRHAGLMCVLAPPTTHATHNRIKIWT